VGRRRAPDGLHIRVPAPRLAQLPHAQRRVEQQQVRQPHEQRARRLQHRAEHRAQLACAGPASGRRTPAAGDVRRHAACSRGVTAPDSSAPCCQQVRAPLTCTAMHALLFVAVTVSLRSQWPRKVSLVAGLTRAWREARLTLPSQPPAVAQVSCMQVGFGGRTCDAHACEIVEQRRGRIHRHDDDQRRRAGDDLPGRAPSQQQSPLLARIPCVWPQGTHRRTRSQWSAHHACSATIRVALQTGVHLFHMIYSLLLWALPRQTHAWQLRCRTCSESMVSSCTPSPSVPGSAATTGSSAPAMNTKPSTPSQPTILSGRTSNDAMK